MLQRKATFWLVKNAFSIDIVMAALEQSGLAYGG